MKILKGVLAQDELGRPFLEYIIEVEYKFQTWRLSKKFHHFANFHKMLKKNFEKIKLPHSSEIFTRISDTSYYNFHENKLKYLEKYIKDISTFDVIVKSNLFKKFFGFDDHVLENLKEDIIKNTYSKINISEYYSDEDKPRIESMIDSSVSLTNNPNLNKSLSYNFNKKFKINEKIPESEVYPQKLLYLGKY